MERAAESLCTLLPYGVPVRVRVLFSRIMILLFGDGAGAQGLMRAKKELCHSSTSPALR